MQPSVSIMEIVHNVPLIHDLLRAVNAHDADGVAAFYADDYEGLDVSRAALCRGRGGVRDNLREWFSAFPTLQVTSREVVTQPGRVALYWTAEAIHEGVFLHVPPTGRRVEVNGFSLLSLREDRIVCGLHLWDLAGLLRSMRLLPDLPGAASEGSLSAQLSRFLTCMEEGAQAGRSPHTTSKRSCP